MGNNTYKGISKEELYQAHVNILQYANLNEDQVRFNNDNIHNELINLQSVHSQ
jgi:hypothetical protein